MANKYDGEWMWVKNFYSSIYMIVPILNIVLEQ